MSRYRSPLPRQPLAGAERSLHRTCNIDIINCYVCVTKISDLMDSTKCVQSDCPHQRHNYCTGKRFCSSQCKIMDDSSNETADKSAGSGKQNIPIAKNKESDGRQKDNLIDLTHECYEQLNDFVKSPNASSNKSNKSENGGFVDVIMSPRTLIESDDFKNSPMDGSFGSDEVTGLKSKVNELESATHRLEFARVNLQADIQSVHEANSGIMESYYHELKQYIDSEINSVKEIMRYFTSALESVVERLEVSGHQNRTITQANSGLKTNKSDVAKCPYSKLDKGDSDGNNEAHGQSNTPKMRINPFAVRKNMKKEGVPIVADAGSFAPVPDEQSRTNIFCLNITSRVNESTVLSYFGGFGDILSMYINARKKYLLIKYGDSSSAIKAINEMNNSIIDGSRVRCSFSKNEYKFNKGDAAQDISQVDLPKPAADKTKNSREGREITEENIRSNVTATGSDRTKGNDTKIFEVFLEIQVV